jgi:hypothetical protein
MRLKEYVRNLADEEKGKQKAAKKIVRVKKKVDISEQSTSRNSYLVTKHRISGNNQQFWLQRGM